MKQQTTQTIDPKSEVQMALEAVGSKVPAGAKPLIAEALLRMEKEDLTAMEVLDLSPEIIEEIYQYGYFLFQAGKYKQALPVFNSLKLLDPKEPRYIFCGAACHHHLGHYLEAAGHYMIYSMFDNENPLPFLHMYDCFKKAGHKDLAHNALRRAAALAEKHGRYKEIKERVVLELASL